MLLGERPLHLAVPADQLAEPDRPAEGDQHEQAAEDHPGAPVDDAVLHVDGPADRGVVRAEVLEVVRREALGPGPGEGLEPGGTGHVGGREGADGLLDGRGVGTGLPGGEGAGQPRLGRRLHVDVVVHVVDGLQEPELPQHDQEREQDRERHPGT
ncbi:hypothetical protein [Nocardioides panacis]|uniref:hypothetical protein n=1 Tax=Nocardioides panacis TaxID=2849501 RepID=UPI0020B26E3A|nr:hypothetical protein [Nocardioides panacis]